LTFGVSELLFTITSLIAALIVGLLFRLACERDGEPSKWSNLPAEISTHWKRMLREAWPLSQLEKFTAPLQIPMRQRVTA